MRLSPTSYESFWACPERYRLSRLVVPAERPAPLRQGSAFHAAVEAHRAGWEYARIGGMLEGAIPTPAGEMLSLSTAESSEVAEWYAAWVRQESSTLRPVSVEAWYEVPLGTDEVTHETHTLYGRLDAVVEYGGSLWVHEIKTDGATSTEALEKAARTEWPRRMQLRAETLGAQALGHPVVGVLLELVSKRGTHHCVLQTIRFTSEELEAAKADLLLTAQTVTIMHSVSPQGPWPHPARQWPCSRLGACEYEAVCMRAGAPEPDGMVWVKPERPKEAPNEGRKQEGEEARDAVPALG